MEYKDYYKILGVDKNATTDEIKKAYRKLVKKYHPDSGEEKTRSKEKFQEVSEAYEVLKDEEKRKKYDTFGASGNFSQGANFDPSQYGYSVNFGGGGSDFSDFFNMIFGGGAGGGFNFSNFGRGAKQSYQTAGGNPFDGFGQTAYEQPMAQAEAHISVYEAYHGTQRMFMLDTGNGQKQIEVKIPAGMKTGEKLRMKSSGVEVKITVDPDDVYSLDGTKLTQNVKIQTYDAVLGGKATFTTIDGSSISLNIKPGTQSGKKFRIPSKGFKDRKGNVSDLIVNTVIVIPENISDEEKKLYEKLKEIRNKN